MSIVFSNNSSKIGLLEMLDQACGTDDNTPNFTKAIKTAKINLALDKALAIIFRVSKSGWSFDDGNHTTDPIITTNLVSGQRDYHFTADDEGSLILDIYRVAVKGTDGVFRLINPISQKVGAEEDTEDYYDGGNTEGTPTTYDKTGNGIFLDPIPSYNSTNGLKMYINREATYFTTSDTTKKAGIDGLCHDFLYLDPAYEYARDHNLPNVERLFRDLTSSIKRIEERYGTREKDVARRIVPAYHNMK